MDNSELYHHGVLGMRWGVRRYQNKDGSLTKAGRGRYNREPSRLTIKKKKSTATNRTQTKLSKPDNLSKLSNEEIQAKIDRMNLEKRYRELAREQLSTVPKKDISMGRKFVEETLTAAGKDIGKQAVAWMLGAATNKVLEKVFNEKNIVDPKHIQKNKK